ncbi:hypothetical protein GJ689_12605 [Rhodoplanes serenus]|uniref:Tetratricopeptide repeat protein n=1 Tax=Rhodoplanes serenus TaxID=200615 RepID=A0A9X5ATA5_9BRAD|nr:hypothetical protein [Rhodoplanes serenus]MTW17045.1 hypothetical protein [Rhodoplanes serenus]
MLRSDGTLELSEAEIRAALTRVLASPRFRDSPQISAFLSYVVDRTLAGRSDQIKGYTIAVEALGRDASFDPNSQSIVRTEAARLRQELARYYADAGHDDAVRITLPRGRYVPVFECGPPAVPPETAEMPTVDAAAPAPAATAPLAPDIRTVPAPAGGDRRGRIGAAWLPVAVMVIGALVAYGLVNTLVLRAQRSRTPAVEQADDPVRASAYAARHGEPRIAVAPMTTTGAVREGRVDPAAVHTILVNALSRFEDIVVVLARPGNDRPGAVPADYLLTPILVYGNESDPVLTLRLTTLPDQAVIWHADFETARPGETREVARRRVALEALSILLEPFGIVAAAERRKQEQQQPPRYGCALLAAKVARYYDPGRHTQTRECLERAIADDPGFVLAHVLLARLHVRDYVHGLSVSSDLSTAVALAHRAVELGPNSARAHYTLMQIELARGRVERAHELARKALALNPYDVRVLMQVGGFMVATGDVDGGLALLQQARRHLSTNPHPLAWSLFLAHYLRDEMAEAAADIAEMPGEYDINLVARALLSARTGDPEGARAALAVLHARQPTWIEGAQERLSRLVAAPWIRDRLEADLKAIGGADTH